jgi:hypothetical protein
MFFNNNFIYHKKQCLPKTLCTSIIDFFDENPNKHKGCVYSGINDLNVNSEVKDSIDLSINFNKNQESCIFNLHHYLCTEINLYRKKYSFLDDLENWKLNETFNIRKYYPDQAFKKLHCEHGPGDCSVRILAWMFYLNDVKNNGETYFSYQNKKFKPRQGDLLIWPAFWTHPHKGIPSKKDIKYIATGWISFS